MIPRPFSTFVWLLVALASISSVIPSHSASATFNASDTWVVDGRTTVERVVAQQIPPHIFVGTAKIDGIFAPTGTELTAIIDGVVQGSTTVQDGGSYLLQVSQSSGTLIVFMIGNLTADQTATWKLGGANVLDLTASAIPTLIIPIDIKPGDDTNRINLKSNSPIPVAILGSDILDVADVDVTTLAFGPSGASPAGAKPGHFRDVNKDGFVDLISRYRQTETGLEPSHAEACLIGRLLDGSSFEGCDAVMVWTNTKVQSHSSVARDRWTGISSYSFVWSWWRWGY